MLVRGSHVRLLAAGARRATSVVWFVNAGRGFHDMAGSQVPAKQGLYDPANEKDSCGAYTQHVKAGRDHKNHL